MKEGAVAHPDDIQEIQSRGAHHPAADAEHRQVHAYREYRQEKHLEAAAHHLRAADEAQRRGERQAVDRHRLFYDLHRKALGLHKELGVPAAIRARLAGAKRGHSQGFTAHPADQWVLRR